MNRTFAAVIAAAIIHTPSAHGAGVVESEAKVWVQGILLGLLQGHEPHSKVLCPVGIEAGLRKELASFRPEKGDRLMLADVVKVESLDVADVGQVQNAQIKLTYRTRSQGAMVSVRKIAGSFCLRDAITDARARELYQETMRSLQSSKK